MWLHALALLLCLVSGISIKEGMIFLKPRGGGGNKNAQGNQALSNVPRN